MWGLIPLSFLCVVRTPLVSALPSERHANIEAGGCAGNTKTDSLDVPNALRREKLQSPVAPPLLILFAVPSSSRCFADTNTSSFTSFTLKSIHSKYNLGCPTGLDYRQFDVETIDSWLWEMEHIVVNEAIWNEVVS